MPPLFQPLFAAMIMIAIAQNCWAAPANWCERTPGQGGECV